MVRKVKAVPPDIKQFFSQARALRHVSVAGTKLPPDAVRAMLQGLAYNSHVSDLHLDLSSCELRSAGAQVIQDLIPDASAISDLDLSDNGFDSDMVTLVLSIGRSKSIRHVSLGKNFNIKSKDGLLDVLHRIVQLTQEDDCGDGDSHVSPSPSPTQPLQSLSVAESRLKLGTNVLLSALGSNTSLTALDISGNAMGDTGAKMLAKALQINTKLRTVVWDRNNTTALGLLEVAQALERNYTLKSMPLPMSDVAQAYRSNPERTEEAVHKVGGTRAGVGVRGTDPIPDTHPTIHLSILLLQLQSCLARNQMRRALPVQTFRLQQGILASSSEQMVNEICLSLQKHVDILSSCPGREVEADILCAEEAIRNANLAVSILPLLYEAGNTPYQSGKLQHKLECLTEEASQTCGREIQAIMQAAMDTAHSLCPPVMQRSGVRDQLVNAMSERIHLQEHLNLSAVLDQMVTDVFSKLNEIKLSVTAAVADCIVDAVLGDLSAAQCKLAESLPTHGLDLLEPAEDDAAALARSRNLSDLAEKGFVVEEYKMALRRKNKHFRSIRPTTTVRTSSPLPPNYLSPQITPNQTAQGAAHRAGTTHGGKEEGGSPKSPLPCNPSPKIPSGGGGPSELELAASGKARPAATKDAEPAAGALPGTPPAEALMDLPTAGERLEHCTKARPRPNRRHKQPPSKPNVQPVVHENSEDRSITRVDEGLEDFFTKRLISEELPPMVLETGPGSAPLVSSSSRTLKKKIGNFFAFKKPKSSRGSRCEKEPEGSTAAPRSRRSMLSDILRAPSKAGEPGKALSKSEEGALSTEPEHSQTPEAARRIRPKYSREGKSQSLILLPGEDEEALGVRQDKKRHLEKSDGELPNSFEQRVHVMLHRMGVTKGLGAEGKKQQNKDSEIKKAGSDGDIVDSSADSPPSLKARTHSVSTDVALRSAAEPSPAWKALGRQLNVELPGPSWEQQPRRCSAGPEQSGQPAHGGEPAAGTPLPASPRSGTEGTRTTTGASWPCGVPRGQPDFLMPSPAAFADNRLATPRLAAPSGRRAVSVHEEQLREPQCLAELGTVTIPLRLRRSPVLKRRPEVVGEHSPSSEAGGEAGVRRSAPHAKRGLHPLTPVFTAFPGTTPQDRPRGGLEEPQPGATGHGERPGGLTQTVVNAQDSAVDQRSPVPGRGEPALGQ
ncbi:Leucine-rich repeat-containing protein 16C [Aix galericulata]|nr:Leucine-rich repeat-containing protein 16C [Aix galericulata]